MHSITVSAYMPFYKFGGLDRLWFAHTLAMEYVDAQLLLFFTIVLPRIQGKNNPYGASDFHFWHMKFRSNRA
jgi:hypothetical protein